MARRVRRVESGLLTPVAVAGRGEARHTIAERMRRHHVPGVSVAVIDGLRVAWARGYGVREAGAPEPVDTATLFLAGSISKPVTATAALQLVEAGRLDLDADVNTVLRTWKVPASAFTRRERVTVRRILSHSAGLTVHGFPGYRADAPLPTVVQVLNGAPPANTAPVRVDYVPGTRWRYSGGGYTVLQLLLEDVTGRRFADLMAETVLEPAGMTHSTFANPLPEAYRPRAATGHEEPDRPVPGKYHTYPEMAAAGLWTTASDLGRWAIAVMRAYRGESSALFSAATAREMLREQVAGWGLGVVLEGEGEDFRLSHGGRDEGFVAHLVAYPARGQGVVVLTNGVSGALIEEIVRSVAVEYGWPVEPRPTRTVTSLTADRLREFAGRYALALAGDTTWLGVAATDSSLRLAGTGAAFEFLPQEDELFFSLDGPTLRFGRGPGGRVAGLVLRHRGREFQASRAPE